MKPPILIDCDEVLSDFVGACLKLAHTAGVYATRESITSWDIAKCIGWPRLNEAITYGVLHHDLCWRLAEIPDAIAWLRDVESTFGRDRVFVCTHPFNAVWATQRAQWLEARGVPVERQIQCKAKHLISGYLIDDAQHHIEGRDNRGFLLAAPWNQPGYRYPRGDHAAALAWLKAVA